ncbi:MAG: hypothetical protein LBT99_02255 [Bifidobacteriaceae bacterium]|jgi:hypothetical protein|nr:hypothetical protein [Bifidobacteriaceae bacterium]
MIKKISLLTICIFGFIGLTACSQNNTTQTSIPNPTNSTSPKLINEKGQEVNPEEYFKDLSSLEASTGVSLKTDCLLSTSFNSIIQKDTNPVAEAKCETKDNNKITFRGQKTDDLTDISGIYETYENSKNPTINNASVYEKYNTKKDKAGYAFWYNEKLKTSYSIQFSKWDEEYLKKIV